MNVCLATTHLFFNTTLGGHAWVFLNQALGLQDAGCRVTLLEELRRDIAPGELRDRLVALHDHLHSLGLDARLCLVVNESRQDALREVFAELRPFVRTLDQAANECELLINCRYAMAADIVGRFGRTALLDIDPGLLQVWMAEGQVQPAPHDTYFSIGETVGTDAARFPDCGITWHYSPPPVHLPSWPVQPPPDDAAPFVTVTNWWGKYEWVAGATFNNEKRTHFMAMLDLPRRTDAELELAIYHEEGNASEMPLLREHGWRARPASEVSGSPEQYREYLQTARGEFSCAKPSCMHFQNAWISDRTICFLASGRPAVVQHTGVSRFLPDRCGLLRFRSVDEAIECLALVANDPQQHARCARELAEAHFDASRVIPHLLDRAMARTQT